MFRKIIIEDSIGIETAGESHKTDILLAASKKYINKIISDYGIVIKILEIQKILFTEVFEDGFLSHIEIKLLIFQPFENEIIECTIINQDETGLMVEHAILDKIIVKTFFPGTEKNFFNNAKSNQISVVWVWNYKNNKFYFKNNQKVRVKISNIFYDPFQIEAKIDEMGLGPVEWW